MKILMYRITICLLCLLLIQSFSGMAEYTSGEDNSSVHSNLAKPNPFLKTEIKEEEGGYISETDILFTIDEVDKDSGEDVSQESVTGKEEKKKVQSKSKDDKNALTYKLISQYLESYGLSVFPCCFS